MRVNLKKLVDSKLAKAKITPDDARDVLGALDAEPSIRAADFKQLARLAALPDARFEKRDEFIPNPYDARGGVTVKADPQRWIQSALALPRRR